MRNVRKKIKEIREEKKLTQEEFARRLGKKRVTISNIECNRTSITDDDIYSIARVLQVSPELLIRDESDKKSLNNMFYGAAVDLNVSNEISAIIKSLESILSKISVYQK